jgi:hypothetical protein
LLDLPKDDKYVLQAFSSPDNGSGASKKKKRYVNGSGMLMDMGHLDWRSLVPPEKHEN